MGCKIIGWGKAIPELVVTNDDLATMVDTSDEWIVERTGIHTRHIAVEETTTSLAVEAGRAALAKAQLNPEDIDLLICMTITPDAIIPAAACLIKAKLGLANAVAFDLNAACAGCVYGLDVASSMIEASALAAHGTPGARPRNAFRHALVIGVDRLSKIVDWTDRATCVLFGDGAGAAVLAWDEAAPGILSSFMKNTDDTDLYLACDTIYDNSTNPFCEAAPATVRDIMGVEASADESNFIPFITMAGQAVFKFATASMTDAVKIACERAGVALDEVDFIVPHQANERIIRYAAKKLGLPMEKFQVSIGSVGNTSASSALMALADAFDEGKIHPGNKVAMVAFGGGLTCGSVLFEA